MRADVVRFLLPDPSDVSGLQRAIRNGVVDPRQIVAVIGKTHGNGLVNDYTRGYLAQSLSLTIGEATGERPAAVRERIPFIFSGGVEGVLSPHYLVFTVGSDAAPPTGKALGVGIAFTPQLNPEDIGRQRQIDLTAAAVAEAMAAAAIMDPADVHFVQVKGPAFALADIAASQRAGFVPASDNPGKLMGLGRAASALGVGKALGEIAAERASEAALLKDFSAFSSVASCLAGVEVRVNEVVVVGMSDKWSGTLAIAHAPLADALDVSGMARALRDLGFEAPRQLSASDATRLRAAFVKCEASRDGLVGANPTRC
jgi:cyanuric acid amidohydrolase